ncbi:MAG TPA: NADH-quinone oxidoreductase subunit L [Acidimicrobiaceae bacterium]|nr:NADH-quinone oxidoreductase subunit L [Acidimicrobiaceae bacterium]
MEKLLWIIPAIPFAGFLFLVVFGRRLGDPGAGWIATTAVGGSFLAVVAVFVELMGNDAESRMLHQSVFDWIAAGRFSVGFGLLADPLSVTMCLFVTGVGALIHLYAIGYMKGDPRFSKFFVYLNLFITAMLMLVLGDNLLLTFLGWEGVGACSYFLISFWHEDPANASAGKKAFVTNRIGDWGFMIGTFLVWTTIGSINYLDISEAAHSGRIVGGTAVAIALLFMVGAAGKSAQLPLFVWLPDAMAGPTPVSALIHAATMVTSGVYLLVRLNPVLHEASWANDVIAWVGVITALVAATIAVSQNDIKKVLAYSTVSQLGYLFLAVGTRNYVAAIFHMVTHAFFKALMFLGSGSVIVGMAHEQDMRKFGNLRKYMPITAGTFIIGWLAIAGVPPFSGFWSKDEILAGAWAENKVMWALGLLTALLTAFYMSRQVFLTFFGTEKWREPVTAVHHEASGEGVEESTAAENAHSNDHDHGSHLTPDHTPRESPWVMTLPLVVLSLLALVAGVLNLPFSSGTKHLEHWLEPVVGSHELGVEGSQLVVLAVVAVLCGLIGIGFAAMVYLRGKGSPAAIERAEFAHGWYIDEAYSWFMGGPGRKFFEAVSWFDRTVIDGVVNGVAAGVSATGSGLRLAQTGRVRNSAIGIAAGTVAVLVYVVVRMSV